VVSEQSGTEFQPPRALEWYPDKLAWQFNFSRAQLRKLENLEDIHELLKRENEAGAITRQEAVSMVPPLFLDVKSHHRVSRPAAPSWVVFRQQAWSDVVCPHVWGLGNGWALVRRPVSYLSLLP
jgi:hypothetical protein